MLKCPFKFNVYGQDPVKSPRSAVKPPCLMVNHVVKFRSQLLTFFPLANLSQTRSLAARSFVKLLSLLNWRLANLEMFSGIFPVPLWSKARNTNKRFPLSQLHFSLEKALIQVFSTVVTWGLSKQSQTRSKMSFFSFAKLSHD
jgi:hypothetical protein